MKKKSVVLILILLILVGLTFTISKIINNENSNNYQHKNAVIKQYKLGTDKLLKTIKIDSKKDLNKLEKYVKELKPLDKYELVSLRLAQEIDIDYDDHISIGIQLSEKNFCYYIDSNKNISSLSYMPEGLYEWVEEKIK